MDVNFKTKAKARKLLCNGAQVERILRETNWVAIENLDVAYLNGQTGEISQSRLLLSGWSTSTEDTTEEPRVELHGPDFLGEFSCLDSGRSNLDLNICSDLSSHLKDFYGKYLDVPNMTDEEIYVLINNIFLNSKDYFNLRFSPASRSIFVGEADGPSRPEAEIKNSRVFEIPQNVFEEFKNRCESGSYYLAANELISFVNQHCLIDDIPVRDNDWCRTHRCPPPSVTDKCKAYLYEDWKFSNIDGKPSRNFVVNLEKAVESATVALNLSMNNDQFNRLLKIDRKKVFHDVTWNPYVIYATNMKDAEMFEFAGHEEFYTQLYQVRARIGLNGDYGYRSLLGGFIAEGLNHSTMDNIIEGINIGITRIRDSAVGDIVKLAIDKIWSLVSGVVSFITGTYEDFFKSLKKTICRYILKIFELDEWVDFTQSQEFKEKVFISVSIMGFLFLVGAYVFTYSIATNIVNKLIKSRQCFVGEAEMSPVAFLTTSLGGLYCLNTADTKAIREKAQLMITLLAGGTILANMGACAFALLPTLLQDAVVYRFGTDEQRIRRQVREWKAQASALIHFSTVSKVVGTEYYIELVSQSMKLGSEIQEKMTDKCFASLRVSVLGIFLKLQKIYMNINSFVLSGSKRHEPFSIHIFGMPGVGKTLLGERLIVRSCDADCNSIYAKNACEEFWSGYLGQKVVIFDEFLVGPPEIREKTAHGYLCIAGSSQYRLDMPDLTNPFIGIKGSEFSSEIICTINNVAYDRVPGFDDKALQRRRDVVIEIGINPDYKHCVDNCVFDMSKLTRDEVLSTCWIRARLVPRVHRTDWEDRASEWMTFDVLCEEVRKQYKAKLEFQNVIAESWIEIHDDSKSAEELINEELRKTCCLPSEPVSISEAIIKIISDFKGEAKNRHRHKCNNVVNGVECKAPPRRHGPGRFKCSDCGFEEECKEESDSSDRVDFPTVQNLCTEDTHRHECSEFECSRSVGCTKGSRPSFSCSEHQHSSGDEIIYNNKISQGMGADGTIFSNHEEWVKASIKRIYRDSSTAWSFSTETYEKQFHVMETTYSQIVVRTMWTGILVAAMGGLARWLGNEEVPDKVTYSGQSEPRKKISHKKGGKSRWTRNNIHTAEAGKSIQNVNLDLGHLIVNAIPVADRWLVTFAHGLFEHCQMIEEGRIIRLLTNDQIYETTFSHDNIVLCKNPDTGALDYDLVFIYFDCSSLPKFKNVINCFASDSELPEGRFRISVRTRTGLILTDAVRDVNSYSYDGMSFYLTDGFMYQGLTHSGDCGIPILLAETKAVRKCIGLHVAGTVNKDYPYGLAVRISREMIDEAIGEDLEKSSFVAESCDFLDVIEESYVPNLKSITKVPKNAQVYLNSVTKLKPSAISRFLPWKANKAPAIMSKEDPRSKGEVPIENAILRLAKADKVKLDQNTLEEVSSEMVHNLSAELNYQGTGGTRLLSFEEAIFGIPGVLAPICTKTHAGYPYCFFVNKLGKRELVWHENGEGRYSENFKHHCLETFNKVCRGENLDKLFLGFQKDELRSQSKIDSVNTRIIYSNDVTYNVVCRMLFGSMVAAFNCSFPAHGYALGINPSSYDAQKIYHRLRFSSERLVAGDFSEFDLRHQRAVMDESFKILEKLGSGIPHSSIVFEHVRFHETEKPFQIGPWRLETESNNASGGFWTTILNCLTVEIYFRYAFKKRFPGKIFDHYISGVFLGDDHIISVSKEIEWNPLMIKDDMIMLGQKYTSAWKDRELTNKYEKFDEVLFLGNHFVSVNGHWSGALRKSTLEESILWTRNHNLTITEECMQMVEYASQWDEQYFNWYQGCVNEALLRIGKDKLNLPPWRSLRTIVASRTVDSGESFRFVAQADSVQEAISKSGDRAFNPGLTTFNTVTGISEQSEIYVPPGPLSRSVNEVPSSLEMGPDSMVRRYQLNWSSTNNIGTELLSAFANSAIAVPYQLMGLGDQNNIQNMPFQNFLLSHPDVEITIQLNGSPTQAGILTAYFVPLNGQAPQYTNWAMLPHLHLSPNMNSSGVLKLPYRYWRTFLDNQSAHDTTWVMGYFHLAVYSPLTTKTLPSDCGVTIFSRFSTTNRIPRTMPPSAANSRPIYGFTKGTGDKFGYIYSSDTNFVAQGGNMSTTNVNNTYTISDVVGNIPVDSSTDSSGNQDLNQSAKFKGIPLDNPPIVGGGIPVQQQFSSMSKSNGPEPTVGMYLHPGEMFRQPLYYRDDTETSISGLCGRPARIFNFAWTTAQNDGTDLYQLALCSLFGNDEPIGTNLQEDMPLNVVILNEFKFIRCDVVYSVIVVKTKFHSGRLMASVNYGAQDVVPSQKEALYNNILDFSGDASVQEIRIPYNNTQEYIRAISNETDLTNSLRFGTLFFSVLNELRVSSEVVATSVDVIVEVRFENVRLAVPNPYSNCIIGDTETSRLTFIAQAGETKEEADVNEEPTVITTTAVGNPVPNPMCKVVMGEKFEYTVSDIHELLRRYNYYPISKITRIEDVYGPVHTSVAPPGIRYTVYRISVEPQTYWNNMYMGWSGMLKFRLYAQTGAPCLVVYTPHNKRADGLDVDRSEIFTVNMGTCNNPSGGSTIQAATWPNFAAREMMYPLSNNMSFLDVSVPFATELNFLPTTRQDASLRPGLGRFGNGYLYLRVPYQTPIEVFYAAGDDFRYHVFSPSRGIRRRLWVGLAGFPTGTTYEVAGVQNP